MAEGKCCRQIYPLMPRPLEVVLGLLLGTLMLSEDMMREWGGSNEWLSWMDSLDECINQADLDDLRF